MRKSFDAREVVAGIDFEVRDAECVGFLGPNGAGKTTTIRMITCQSPLGDGSIEVFGLPVGPRTERRIKSRLGIVPQEDNLDPDLSVRTNLEVYASYFGISRTIAAPRIDELLKLFSLADRADARIDTLSGGLKRRLTIARALVNSPELLVLDEPTTGLDPQARHLLWDQLRNLSRSGTAMLLTTHYMEEAAQLCDRILILDQGRILAEGTPRELIHRFAGREVIEVRGEVPIEQVRVCAALAARVERSDHRVSFHLDGDRAALPLLEALAGFEVLQRSANLEDVFLHLTGKGLRD